MTVVDTIKTTARKPAAGFGMGAATGIGLHGGVSKVTEESFAPDAQGANAQVQAQLELNADRTRILGVGAAGLIVALGIVGVGNFIDNEWVSMYGLGDATGIAVSTIGTLALNEIET